MSGKVPVAELPRLLDVLENTSGILEYAVSGSADRQGNPMLEVSISGSCQLRCQRCLGALEHAVQVHAHLRLCDQAGLDALDGSIADDEDDEVDSILADTHLDVLALLEEEILLSLPIAPRHEPGICQAANGGDAHQEEQNPFAVLAKLKRS